MNIEKAEAELKKYLKYEGKNLRLKNNLLVSEKIELVFIAPLASDEYNKFIRLFIMNEYKKETINLFLDQELTLCFLLERDENLNDHQWLRLDDFLNFYIL